VVKWFFFYFQAKYSTIMKYSWFLFCALLLVSCTEAPFTEISQAKNEFNKFNQKHGRWIEYGSEDEKYTSDSYAKIFVGTGSDRVQRRIFKNIKWHNDSSNGKDYYRLIEYDQGVPKGIVREYIYIDSTTKAIYQQVDFDSVTSYSLHRLYTLGNCTPTVFNECYIDTMFIYNPSLNSVLPYAVFDSNNTVIRLMTYQNKYVGKDTINNDEIYSLTSVQSNSYSVTKRELPKEFLDKMIGLSELNNLNKKYDIYLDFFPANYDWTGDYYLNDDTLFLTRFERSRIDSISENEITSSREVSQPDVDLMLGSLGYERNYSNIKRFYDEGRREELQRKRRAEEIERNRMAERSSSIYNYGNWSSSPNCSVNIQSEYEIQRYLEKGLRTEGNGGSVITYKTLWEWNTVGLEVRFDNGTVVKGINVRITPGYSRARISVDFPSIGPGDYYLYSNGILKSADGTFTYNCR